MNWTVLSIGTLMVLLPSVAVMLGWVPSFLEHRPGPTRLLGISGTLLYAALLAKILPALTEASTGVSNACAYAAVALVVLAVLTGIIYEIKSGSPPGSRG